jgi:hypothetical protein
MINAGRIPATVYYAEYNTMGPGSEHISERRSEEHILTEDEAAAFTVDSVFLGPPEWIDYDYVY